MTNHIKKYYQEAFKEAIWLVGIAFVNFTAGILAIANWGEVGVGILLVLGAYGIIQVIVGFWVLLAEQNRAARKIASFEQEAPRFIPAEIKDMEEKRHRLSKNRTAHMISFLVGMLLLLMAAFQV